MESIITKVLKEKVDPLLASHFGGAVLTAFENDIAYIKLTGECSSCPSAQYTIEDVVKGIIMEEIPEVKDVVLDTSVSDDILEMARKILNKEKGKPE
ncbi:MAG: NifU family protein [Eubacteriales bacterium]|nr:NifU family protein [Eubacteriales bacterium]